MSDEISEIQPDKLFKLAQAVANGECGDYVYCLQNGKFYEYTKGVWQEIIIEKLMAQIQDRLIREVKQKSKDKEGNEIWKSQKGKILTKYTPYKKKQIIDHLKIIKYKELSDFNTFPILNLENYMLETSQCSVVNHNKDFYSTIRVPYNYKMLADSPLWKKTLNEIFESDQNKINALQEFFGYCLTRDVRMEKGLLLLGESRSGKSTILNTLQYMVGINNCSHVSLEHLDNPQYTSMMINKLVNIDGEVSKKAEAYEAKFKTIVTGHEVKCNDKFMPPFDFRPYCKFVMSANEFPRITDHSSAFYKRLILIPCDRVFSEEEQNIDLRNQLLEELPGILNWSIEGLKRLYKRGRFEQTEFMKEAINQLEDENNLCNIFFNDHIEVDTNDGAYVEKSFLFEKYQKWCKQTESYTLNHIVFAKNVFKKFYKTTPKNSRLSGNGPRIWRNLRYIDSKETNKQDVNWQDSPL